jgi:hypothetical protein
MQARKISVGEMWKSEPAVTSQSSRRSTRKSFLHMPASGDPRKMIQAAHVS